MIFSDALEVAIGLVFIFLLLSLVLAAVNELIESFLRSRGAKLFDGIRELLSDPTSLSRGLDEAKAIYTHPLVQSLMRGDIGAATKNRALLPSYVPSRNFALALIDQTLNGKLVAAKTKSSLPASASPLDRLALAAERIDNDQVRGTMLVAVDVGRGDMERTRAHLEGWYDSGMDRVSGWYKRRTQRIIFVLGLAAAVALNINTMTMADSLSKDATLRRTVAAQAGLVAPDGAPAMGTQAAVAAIDHTGLPIGWSDAAVTALHKPITAQATPIRTGMGWIQIALGYLLTAFAVSLGAPFWFDVLNRLMVIRATVKPTEKSQDEAPQDPQAEGNAGKFVVQLKQPAPPAPPPSHNPDAMDTDVYAEPPESAERLFEDDHQQPVKGIAA